MKMKNPMVKNNQKIAVIGAGSWGTALAMVLASKAFLYRCGDIIRHILRSYRKKEKTQHTLPDFHLMTIFVQQLT